MDPLFSLSLLTLVAAYHGLAPQYPTVKKKAWVLTTISSCIMTAASIPFVLEYIQVGGRVSSLQQGGEMARVVSTVFQAYLAADLAMGAIYYRSQVNLISGWLHHVLYIFIVQYAILRDWSNILCLCFCMELPTFFLGIASLYPSLRSDVLFATCFFITRIAFHVVMFSSYLWNNSVVGSFGPAVILAAAFPMHAIWFMGCIKGFIRRAKMQKKEKRALSKRTHKKKLSVSVPSIQLEPVSVSLFSTEREDEMLAHSEPELRRRPSLDDDSSSGSDSTLPPTPPERQPILDRTLVKRTKEELTRALHKLRQSDKFVRLDRARRHLYAKFPDRRQVIEYVRSNVGMDMQDGDDEDDGPIRIVGAY